MPNLQSQFPETAYQNFLSHSWDEELLRRCERNVFVCIKYFLHTRTIERVRINRIEGGNGGSSRFSTTTSAYANIYFCTWQTVVPPSRLQDKRTNERRTLAQIGRGRMTKSAKTLSVLPRSKKVRSNGFLHFSFVDMSTKRRLVVFFVFALCYHSYKGHESAGDTI